MEVVLKIHDGSKIVHLAKLVFHADCGHAIRKSHDCRMQSLRYHHIHAGDKSSSSVVVNGLVDCLRNHLVLRCDVFGSV